MSKKTIEEIYKKLTQREHVLLRPDTYIGSVKKQMEELWLPCNKDNTIKMEKTMVEYSPGFIKIFDEVLTNATDHSFRDSTVKSIKVEYSQESGEISIWNDGNGIPIELHKEHNIYVPELIFGHLLSGSNYDDSQSRTGAGRNGYGSKLTNIYSKKFIVETIDSNNKKKFVQEFSENMTEKTKAKITSNSGKSYTKITFIPEYTRFNMDGLEDDTVLLIKKRVLDCIACTNHTVQVYLNGEKLKGKGLVDYTKYFFEGEKIITESFQERVKRGGEVVEYNWEYAIVPYQCYEQVSFVNGNSTTLGGTHVNYITNQIVNKLKKMLEEKKKLKELKPNFIKDKLFLFLRATVSNPVFNSQTKETLTTQSKDFGCSITVSEAFITKLYKSSITEDIVEFCKLKETASLSKQTDGKKVNKVYIPKLEDALWAGGIKSNQCTLILTEGDSAKTFAMWGRSIVGPEKYGVHPLKGKCQSFDTKIPLWNGEIKLAKDIQIGDILIGDDGNERKVLTLYKGNGKMYEVFQDRGESYKVNDEHILTLCMPEHKKIYWVPSKYTWRTLYWDKTINNIKAKEIPLIKVQCKECQIIINTKSFKTHYARKHKNIKYVPYKLEDINTNDKFVIEAQKKMEEFLLKIDDNNIIDICIQDYFKVTKSLQRKLKGIRGECVKWEEKEVLLDPYVLGLWLGDGSASGYSYACDGENDYQAPLKKILEKYNLIKNKHIPKEYLINSKEIRLKVLAGIIDTDGSVYDDGTIQISQSVQLHQQLAYDIVYLARSLGFYTSLNKKVTNYTYVKSGEKAEAYIIKISGDTEQIPMILPRKKSKNLTKYNIVNSTGIIKIKEIDDCNYVGIGIDCNSRFVINDFTVTHNCLNVRDASITQLIGNEEINNIKQILGLKQDKNYKDTSELRYGKVMILTDSDVDGSHIKALLVNFFHYWWPNLLKIDYIQTLKTPIVKAIKGKKVLEFFTEQDYLKWKESGINMNSYQIRYFKGLGTSKKEDAKDTFKRLEELTVDYYYKNKTCEESILLAFEKDKNTKTIKKKDTDTESEDQSNEIIKCTDRRKNWLSNYDKSSYINVNENRVSYQDLINKELIHFSIYDNLRSIPSLCDGLKPSQRKILYYMLKKNPQLIKVAQLSGYVSAETGYHHGEASLQGAIIGMAQNFVGTNNINLLYPEGNFGSRFQCGKDASSPRYIYTRLSDVTHMIFNQSDLPLLDYLNDDGTLIEPEWYLPILPMVLVNGCEGIGTGYSTSIPTYNPKDIIVNLIKMIDDEDFQPLPMKPHFKGFHGQVEELEQGSYVTKGKWEKLSDAQVRISELPVGMGVTIYKEFLESLITGNTNTKNDKSKAKKKKFELKDVRNLTKDENDDICFIIEFSNPQDLSDLIKSGTFEKELKLVKSFSTNNMYLFNEKLILTKYDTPIDILCDFFDIRLEYYEKRKTYIIKKLKEELKYLEAKSRFIKEYIDGNLDINKKSKEIINSLLTENEYPLQDNSFDYLLRQPIYSLTLEKINELLKQCETKKKELLYYKSKTPSQLWKIDLEELLQKV
jgi:DNA gyrase/topoisomerase IV subunit B